jgi:tol-pal system protein YbgF
MKRLRFRFVLGTAGLLSAGALVCGQAWAQNETPAAQAEYRFERLEDQIRTLTGQIETQNHQIEVLTQQLEKMRSDTDLRLNDLESRGAGGSPGVARQATSGADDPRDQAYVPPPGTAGGAGAPTPLYPGAGAAQAGPGAPPRNLGTIPAGPVPEASPADGSSDDDDQAAAETTPKGQYQAAYSLIGQGRFDQAEKAFRSFLAQYPKDPLASSAAYWVGHTFYARGDFQKAAVAFAEGYRKYPKGIKAPDTLLDLGRSLGRLGNTQDACATYAQFDKQFGAGASPAIRKQEQLERNRLRCS